MIFANLSPLQMFSLFQFSSMAKGCADSLITNLFDDLLAENSLLLRYYFGADKKLR